MRLGFDWSHSVYITMVHCTIGCDRGQGHSDACQCSTAIPCQWILSSRPPQLQRGTLCMWSQHLYFALPSLLLSLTFILAFSHLILTFPCPPSSPYHTLTPLLLSPCPVCSPLATLLNFSLSYPILSLHLLFLKLLTFLYIPTSMHVYTVYVQYITKCMRLEQATWIILR